MGDDSRRYTRRALLIGAAGIGGAGAAAALGSNGGSGNLYGGTMALQEAYQVSENLWIGPDSAKTEVKHANGRIYMATDTQVDYYSNDGAWDKLGVGSSIEPVPSVHTEDLEIGPNADVITVSPSDDWHEKVGDVDDPLENALVYVLGGTHETKRRTYLGDNAAIVGVGDATITKPTPFTQDITSNVSEGATTVQVQDGSQFEVGRGIFMEDDNSHQRKDATQAYITDISGNTLTISNPARSALSTSANAYISQTHTLLTNGLDDIEGASNENIHVRNLHLHGAGRDADGPQVWTLGCTYFYGVTGGSIRDCVIEEHHGDGISDQAGVSREIANNNIRQINVHPIHIGIGCEGVEVRNNLCENSTGTGVYTSTSIEGCEILNNDIYDCEGAVPRHGSDAGGIGDFVASNNNNTIRGNYIDLSGAPGAHGLEGRDGTFGNTFIDNTIIVNDANGGHFWNISEYTFRDNRIRVTNPSGEGGEEICLNLRSNVTNVRVIDNYLEAESGSSGCIYVTGNDQGYVIRGNTLKAPGIWPIFIGGSSDHLEWTLEGNIIEEGSGLVYVQSGTAVDWRITDNTYRDGAGVPLNINASTRLVTNGWGTNDGDPSAGGEWNGEGFEGLNVRDVTNSNNYAYIDGGWAAL